MTDESHSDPHPEPGPEVDKPIALGGPLADTPMPPQAEPAPPPTPEPPEPVLAPAPVSPKRSVAMPALGLLGFVILAAAIAYLWVRPVPIAAMPAMAPDESGAVTALQSEVAALKTQLTALDRRETADIAALHTAIAALPPPAAAPAAGPAPSAPPTAPTAPVVAQAAPDAALATIVASLSDRLKQIEAAQTQQTQSLPSAADVSNLGARIDAVTQREAKDSSAIRQDLSLVQQQLASLSDQAQTLTKSAAALPQLSARADRLSQIVRAQDALRAGLPLGAIANAPPALSRFADTAPPTEAALRLAFTDAAREADKAGEPVPDQGGFWHRIWLRAQTLIMVRQGDRVILGDPTSAVLAHARTVLDAGDLSGAVTVVGTLTGPAQAAMAPWAAQARALLAARAALTQMAAS